MLNRSGSGWPNSHMSIVNNIKLPPSSRHSAPKATKEWILVANPIILVELVMRVTIGPNAQLLADKQTVRVKR